MKPPYKLKVDYWTPDRISRWDYDDGQRPARPMRFVRRTQRTKGNAMTWRIASIAGRSTLAVFLVLVGVPTIYVLMRVFGAMFL